MSVTTSTQGSSWKSPELWAIIGVLVNGLAVLAAVVAGAIAYRQYTSGISQEKIKQTIEFLKLSYADPIAPAQQRVWRAIGRHQDEVRDAVEHNKYTMKPPQAAEAYEKMLSDIVAKENLRQDIIDSFSFYDQLATCVNSDICDLAAAKVFFGDDLKTFSGWFAPVIDDLERESGRSYQKTEFVKLLARL